MKLRCGRKYIIAFFEYWQSRGSRITTESGWNECTDSKRCTDAEEGKNVEISSIIKHMEANAYSVVISHVSSNANVLGFV